MLDIEDKSTQPDIAAIRTLINNPLFDSLYEFAVNDMKALCSIEYSGDKLLLGWNMRLYKSGRALCRIYPREGFYKVLVVVGKKEHERVEAALSGLSAYTRDVYNSTQEGMGQRWLLFGVDCNDTVEDIKTLMRIRRESK